MWFDEYKMLSCWGEECGRQLKRTPQICNLISIRDCHDADKAAACT